MSRRIPDGILRREKVAAALDLIPQLKAHVPQKWLDDQGRVEQLVDAHRAYRWLAAGGVGWSGEQLSGLASLFVRLAGKHPVIDRKLTEFWDADDTRVDSLNTELLLADHFLLRGHAIDPEPDIGGRRPEYLVDGRLLVEAKTYCPRRDDAPFDRLRFELCHRVDSGCLLAIDVVGALTANDVAPLVRQAAARLTREEIVVGERYQFVRGSVQLFLRATQRIDDLAEGSHLSIVPTVSDESLLRRSFLPWLEAQVAAADQQMRAHAGPKAVVVDVSHCRVAVDMLEMTAAAVLRVVEEVQRKHPSVRCLIATRWQGHQFGELRFVPHDPADLLSESAARRTTGPAAPPASRSSTRP